MFEHTTGYEELKTVEMYPQQLPKLDDVTLAWKTICEKREYHRRIYRGKHVSFPIFRVDNCTVYANTHLGININTGTVNMAHSIRLKGRHVFPAKRREKITTNKRALRVLEMRRGCVRQNKHRRKQERTGALLKEACGSINEGLPATQRERRGRVDDCNC